MDYLWIRGRSRNCNECEGINMITFIKQKLIHKKWLNLCVAIGLTLFISIIISTTLYQSIALNKMLKEKCNNYIATENAYPMISQLVEEEYIDTGTLSEQFDSRTKFFERITKEIYLLPIKEQFNLVQLPGPLIGSGYLRSVERS